MVDNTYIEKCPCLRYHKDDKILIKDGGDVYDAD